MEYQGHSDDVLELRVSRGKMFGALAFLGLGLAISVAGGIAGQPAAWMLVVLFGAVCGLLVKRIIEAGTPVAVIDADGIDAGKKEGFIRWSDIDELSMLAIVTGAPIRHGEGSRAFRRGKVVTHSLEVWVAGEDGPVRIPLSHLAGNSLDHVAEIEDMAGIEIRRRQQDGALAEPYDL